MKVLCIFLLATLACFSEVNGDFSTGKQKLHLSSVIYSAVII